MSGLVTEKIQILKLLTLAYLILEKIKFNREKLLLERDMLFNELFSCKETEKLNTGAIYSNSIKASLLSIPSVI